MKLREKKIGLCTLYNADCMDMMAKYPDGYFDLAIVDPPYGIGQDWRKNTKSPFFKHCSTYKNKSIPDKKYFDELFRVSDKQIIWGGIYYTQYLPPTGAWIFWDKKRSEKTFAAQGEVVCEPRSGIHPHEKPVLLYKWLLSKYAEPGMRILDTHLGSGSIAIACCELGFQLEACEVYKNYFKASCKRIMNEI